MINKTCTKCHNVKPVDDFYSDKYAKDGKTSWCKACQNKTQRISDDKTKMREQGINVPTGKVKHKLTEKELQYLVENWDTKDLDVIAKYIGVTRTSVLSYGAILRKLGIKLSYKFRANNREVFKSFVQKYLKQHPQN